MRPLKMVRNTESTIFIDLHLEREKSILSTTNVETKDGLYSYFEWPNSERPLNFRFAVAKGLIYMGGL